MEQKEGDEGETMGNLKNRKRAYEHSLASPEITLSTIAQQQDERTTACNLRNNPCILAEHECPGSRRKDLLQSLDKSIIKLILHNWVKPLDSTKFCKSPAVRPKAERLFDIANVSNEWLYSANAIVIADQEPTAFQIVLGLVATDVHNLFEEPQLYFLARPNPRDDLHTGTTFNEALRFD